MKKLKKENHKLHHANILLGKGNGQDFVSKILAANLAFETKANPDFLLTEMETFGIDDARDFEKWVIGKPLAGEHKASLIFVKTITFEAQNALLKVLEEPPSGTFVFISLESLAGLLPTFVSRVMILSLPEEEIVATGKNEIEFLKSSAKEKLRITKNLLKAGDKNIAREFIKNLEEACYKENSSAIVHNPKKAEEIKNILTAKTFASIRGSSPKMLLDWLSSVI